eukprot:maker-scaffold130_size324016-snap-gene-2.22 protein:Tk07107 transcript:maker-scaffold130_size324016-snap-gene-2.22-mRNA-1 annotation:"triple helix repeat-containing collagen"
MAIWLVLPLTHQQESKPKLEQISKSTAKRLLPLPNLRFQELLRQSDPWLSKDIVSRKKRSMPEDQNPQNRMINFNEAQGGSKAVNYGIGCANGQTQVRARRMRHKRNAPESYNPDYPAPNNQAQEQNDAYEQYKTQEEYFLEVQNQQSPNGPELQVGPSYPNDAAQEQNDADEQYKTQEEYFLEVQNQQSPNGPELQVGPSYPNDPAQEQNDADEQYKTQEEYFLEVQNQQSPNGPELQVGPSYPNDAAQEQNDADEQYKTQEEYFLEVQNQQYSNGPELDAGPNYANGPEQQTDQPYPIAQQPQIPKEVLEIHNRRWTRNVPIFHKWNKIKNIHNDNWAHRSLVNMSS